MYVRSTTNNTDLDLSLIGQREGAKVHRVI